VTLVPEIEHELQGAADRLVARQASRHKARYVMRGGRIALARRGLAVLGVAAAAVVIFLASATSTPSPAYAVVQHPDGSVTVTVKNLHTAIKPINARLRALGIPERFIPITSACPAANGGFVYPVKRSQFSQLRWTFSRGESRRFLARGEWGYIGLGRSENGQLLLAQGAMKPPVPSCLNSTLGKVLSTSDSRSSLTSPPSGPPREAYLKRALATYE
jgi:hypothetical protein